MSTITMLSRVSKVLGLEWVTCTPERWLVVRAKVIFRRMQRPVRPEDGVVTAFRDGVVTLRSNRRTTGFTEALQEIGYQGIRKGDLVIHAMDAFAGAIGVSDSDGKGTPVYSVCQPTSDANSWYYALVLREMSRSGYLLSLAKGIRERSTDFRFADFAALTVPQPPIEEQEQVVRFVRQLDARVNRLIKAKRRLIELLNEQKQAIIHEAVTRGLDPDVSLKPSGIDWLGDIPAHWNIRKVKHFARFTGGGTPSKAEPEFWDGDIPWVSPKDMKVSRLADTEDHVTKAAITNSATSLVPTGSLVMVVRSGILRRTIPTAILDREMCLNQDMRAFRLSRVITAEFLQTLIFGCEKDLLVEWCKQGATVESIEHQYMANSQLPMPPLDEQTLILEFIRIQAYQIELTITKAITEIELIREYRTRLVADVVTGQIDVRSHPWANAELAEAEAELVDDAEPENDEETGEEEE